jgi:hypothetical protein
VGYEQKMFNSRHVKRFEPLPNAEEIAAKEIPLALKILQKAFAVLMPLEPVVIVNGIISAYRESITLEPVVYEQETIGAFIERPGYSVTTWKHIPATRHEPDDYVDTVIGTFPNLGAAVKVFITTLFEMKTDDYLQGQAEEEMANDLG